MEDDGTGLVYLNARYYDAKLKRFLSPDPIALTGDPQSINPYSYSRNNPVTLSDASGLCWDYGYAGCADWRTNTTLGAGQINRHFATSSLGSFGGEGGRAFADYLSLDLAPTELEALHFGLEAIGSLSIPIISDAADGANAALYLGEGNYFEASLAAAGLIPFINGAALKGVLRYGDEAAASARLFSYGDKASLGRAQLRKNTEAFAGAKLAPDRDVHHIVAFGSGKAKDARAVLTSAGVEINEVDNGVVLRNTAHRGGQGIHTDAYYTEINARLQNLGATPTRLQVTNELNNIRMEIISGKTWTKK